jgi:hypothetical protein
MVVVAETAANGAWLRDKIPNHKQQIPNKFQIPMTK